MTRNQKSSLLWFLAEWAILLGIVVLFFSAVIFAGTMIKSQNTFLNIAGFGLLFFLLAVDIFCCSPAGMMIITSWKYRKRRRVDRGEHGQNAP